MILQPLIQKKALFSGILLAFCLVSFPNLVKATEYPISSDMPDPESGLNLTDKNPSAAYNTKRNVYLVVWEGLFNRDSNHPDQADTEILAAQVSQLEGVLSRIIIPVSNAGDNDSIRDSFSPSVAYNSTDDQYLVVWHGDAPQGGTVAAGEFEIFGQILGYEGDNLVELGTNDFQISVQGEAGNPAIDAENPVVVYNSTDNQYLVAWQAEAVDGEYEIFGKILKADGTAAVDTFQISNAGVPGIAAQDAINPAAAYNAKLNEYLVVWEADSLGDNLEEIHGERISASGTLMGADDTRISQTGPEDNVQFFATQPDVVWNSQNNEYLVVFEAVVSHGNSDYEMEIFGQRLVFDADGNLIESGTDFRISDTGDEQDRQRDASEPKAAYDSLKNRYFVVWTGDDIGLNEEFEIYGQFVSADGNEIGYNDIRMTYTGPDASIEYGADRPDVVFGETDNGVLVVWEADPVIPMNVEIYGQFFSFSESSGFPPETVLEHWSLY